MAVRNLENLQELLSLGSNKAKASGAPQVEDNDNTSGRTGRLQLVLPEQSFRRLEAIKEITEAASYAEVLRVALRIYEGLLAERSEDADIIVRRKEGEEISIPLRLFIR